MNTLIGLLLWYWSAAMVAGVLHIVFTFNSKDRLKNPLMNYLVDIFMVCVAYPFYILPKAFLTLFLTLIK
jgi:hypothetical protein